MKKYLKYLLSDIETAKKNRPPTAQLSNNVPEIYKGAEEYLNSPLQNMSEWFGLDVRAFPPADRWSEENLTSIVDAMSQLWQVYNYDAAFPEGVGMKLKYQLFVKVLSEPVPWVSTGVVTIDFCDSDVNLCALGEFCVCREMVDFIDDLPHKDDVIIGNPLRKVELSDSMQRYYEQLLNDLGDAVQNLPDHDDFDFEDNFASEEEDDDFFEDDEEKDLEKLNEEEPEIKPLSEWLNVSQAVFPSLEKLSTEMVIELVRAIEKLWWHAGFVPYFPEGLNIEMKYELFREHWSRKVPWPTDESVYLGFCNNDEDNCIYGAEMCTCAIYKLPFEEEEEEFERIEKLIDIEGEDIEGDSAIEDFLREMGYDEGDIEDEDDSLPID